MIEYLENKFNKSFRNDEGNVRWGKIVIVVIFVLALKFVYDAFMPNNWKIIGGKK